jgi:peroxiredoxin
MDRTVAGELRAARSGTEVPLLDARVDLTLPAEVHMPEPIAKGTDAPDFSLPVAPDRKMGLAELRGRPVILAFYPADWSPVCGDQMALYNEMKEEFDAYGAQLVGLSVDGAWCHQAFARDRDLFFPLLADFEPKGDVAKRYGVYRSAEGISERALFVLDAEGKVAWSYVSPLDVNPGADGILEALEKIQRSPHGQTTPREEHAHPAG